MEQEIHYANNSLHRADEATQMNEITQNQGVKEGKPKLESHEIPSR